MSRLVLVASALAGVLVLTLARRPGEVVPAPPADVPAPPPADPAGEDVGVRSDLPVAPPGPDGDVVPVGPIGPECPPPYAWRSGATKKKLLAENGGNAASESAVARGLAWLARQQQPDGGWRFDGPDPDPVAATGLCLLPFLGAGETHTFARKYQKTVAAGLGFLLKGCRLSGPNAGRLSEDVLAHALATLAVCEAYGMTRDKQLLAWAQGAADHIRETQGPNGGWGRRAGDPADMLVTGWQVQALKAAQLARDLVVDRAVLEKADGFLTLAAGGRWRPAFGTADATDAKPGTTPTAVGLLCRYYTGGWGPEDTAIRDGVDELLARRPGGKVLDLDHLHPATQVVYFGWRRWAEWNDGPAGAGGVRDWLIGFQVTTDGPAFGSWDPDGATAGARWGRLGTTALAVLTLEVYYRHLPLYKRVVGDDEAIKLLDGAK